MNKRISALSGASRLHFSSYKFPAPENNRSDGTDPSHSSDHCSETAGSITCAVKLLSQQAELACSESCLELLRFFLQIFNWN